MRRIAIAFVMLLNAACGDGGTPTAEDPNALQLPRVGLLGDLPPADGTVVVTLKADGSLSVQGTPCGWPALTDRLEALTRPPEPKRVKRKVLRARMPAETVEEDLKETDEDGEEVRENEIVAEEPVIKDEEIVDEPSGDLPPESGTMRGKKADLGALAPKPRLKEAFSGGVSNADLLLRIDRRVPMTVVHQLLQTAARPRLLLVRTFYAVRGSDGRGEGAVALFLPKDRGCGEITFVDQDVSTVTLQAKSGEAVNDPVALADALLTRMERPDDLLVVTIRVPPETPFGVLMRAADAALRARAASVLLYGHPRTKKTVAARLAAAKDAGPFRLEVVGTARTLRPPRAPEQPRRHGGYVGVTNDPPLTPEPAVIQDEDLVPDGG